jgi:hypothetical protein
MAARDTLPLVLGALGVGLAFAIAAGGKGNGGGGPLPNGGGGPLPNAPDVNWKDNGEPPEPLAVGQANDPEIDALLRQMDDLFTSSGVDLSHINAAAVTLMRKTDGFHAIPPVEYWPRMAATLRYVFVPIRKALGVPIVITSGYRPPDYNKKVGGKPGSRHQFFEALDMVAPGHARAQALAAARVFVANGAPLHMGFIVYGTPDAPTNIHVDTGWRKRTLKNGPFWVEQVGLA